MIPPRLILVLITGMTCLGFVPAQVGAIATSRQQTWQNTTPGIGIGKFDRASDSTVSFLIAQASSPTPSPNRGKPSPPDSGASPAPKKSRASRLSSLRLPFLWVVGTGVVFLLMAGGFYYLQRRSSSSGGEEPLPDETSTNYTTTPTKILKNNRQHKSERNGYSNSHVPLETPILEESTEKSEANPFYSSLPEAQPEEISPQTPLEANNTNSAIIKPLPEQRPTHGTPQPSAETLQLREVSSLSKLNVVDTLVQDLQNADPGRRRKAIWDLAQRGDSRAIQPLVDLLMDVDSQQRSLILEAISQIGNRTLKPMNRALAISLQDDNAEVRKNAIRDLTQIYEAIYQANKLLLHAVDDPDREVQETARWALNQLSKIRNFSSDDNWPSSSHKK